jgi:lysophospholipase L1-like esterase
MRWAARPPEIGGSRFVPRRPVLLLGLLAFWLGALKYRAFAHRDVFGLWSVPYAIVLVGMAVVFALAWFIAVRVSGGDAGDERRNETARERALLALRDRFLDAAVLAVGLAHLRAGWVDANAGQRFLDLNLFGSADALSAGLGWLGGVALVGVAVISTARAPTGALRNAAVGVCGLLGLFLFVEGALRVRTELRPATQGFPTYSSKAWADQHVRFNADGFRDRDFEAVRAMGGRRLLVVGDSVAFGYGLDQTDARFGEQLAHRLSKARGEAWHALNAAQPNTHTLEHVEFLERTRHYAPDAIVLLYSLNDIDYLVDPADLDAAGNRFFDERFTPVRIAFVNSNLAQELYARARQLRFAAQRRGEGAPAPLRPEIMQQHLSDLARFVALARETTCAVGIAQHGWLPYGSAWIRKSHDEFFEAARTAGLPAWTGLDAFEGEDYTTLVVNDLDHHPSARANTIAAEAIARPLLARIVECER